MTTRAHTLCRSCNDVCQLIGAYRIPAGGNDLGDASAPAGPWYWVCIDCLNHKAHMTFMGRPYEFNQQAIMAIIMER